MKDKVTLLMEETGCERREAELALELCGYQVEKAVREIPRLSRNIGVVKGRFYCSSDNLYGLLWVVLNLKSRSLVRARAVLSYNPATCLLPLEMEWFEFEKNLYAARLADGTVQSLSQEVERSLSDFFHSAESGSLYEMVKAASEEENHQRVEIFLGEFLGRLFRGRSLKLSLKCEVLFSGQFQSVGSWGGASTGILRSSLKLEEGSRMVQPLVLRVVVEGDPNGIPAEEVQAGDSVYAEIIDPRDIAQYLAKLFGGRSEQGLAPLYVPVESVEYGTVPAGTAPTAPGSPIHPPGAVPGTVGQGTAPTEIILRVRFSRGVCGEACIPKGIRIRLTRRSEQDPWWKKWFG
ncbi:MAG: hypothetical protein HY400_05340 [Elusimicrobia bacterium]|nr:hypothetical protein [Elusimicrobiota bacterium]